MVPKLAEGARHLHLVLAVDDVKKFLGVPAVYKSVDPVQISLQVHQLGKYFGELDYNFNGVNINQKEADNGFVVELVNVLGEQDRNQKAQAGDYPEEPLKSAGDIVKPAQVDQHPLLQLQGLVHNGPPLPCHLNEFQVLHDVKNFLGDLIVGL